MSFAAFERVLRAIVKDVADRAARFARTLENTAVIAIGEELAFATKRLVDGLGEPDGQTLQTARKRGVVLRFDNEVQMIPLHTVMHDTNAQARACDTENALDG